MEVKDVGYAGLVGMRGRLGKRVADEIGRRTRLDAELIAAAIGLYLMYSRSRRMIDMVRRLRAAA